MLLGLVCVAPAGAQESEPRLAMSMSRNRWGFSVNACLPSDRPPPPGTNSIKPVDATTEVLVNGRPVSNDGITVWWMQPGIGSEGRCPGNVWVSHRVTLADLAGVGVEPPASGTWSSFDLEIRVDRDGLEQVVGRVIEFGSGPPVGSFDSVTTNPNGAMVRGWVVDPVVGGQAGLRMTVNGRDWPLEQLPSSSSPPPQPLPVLRPLPAPDPVWAERGLGAALGFEIVAPYGRICLFAERNADPDAGIPAASVPLGCRTTTTDGHQRLVIDSVSFTAHSSVNGQDVMIRGRLFDTWGTSPPNSLRALSPSAGLLYATAAPRRDGSGPLPDGAGVYDVTFRYPAVVNGPTDVCFELFATNEPAWWRAWLPRPTWTPLGCRSFYVPPSAPEMPFGTIDIVDVTGGVATVAGWAVDRNGGAPRVLVSANGRIVAVTRTGIGRPDVQRVAGGDGKAGFRTSAVVPKGEQTICAAWEDTTNGAWSAPDCRTVLVK